MKSGVVFVCVFLCILQFKVGQSAHYTQIEIEIPTRTKNLQNSQWKKKVPYPIAKHEHCCDSCHGSCYDSHRRTGNPPKFESQSNTYILSIPLANCHTTTVTIDATHRPSKNVSGTPHPHHGSKHPHHGSKHPHHGSKHPHHGSKDPHHGSKDPHHGSKDPHHDSKEPHHDPKEPHHDPKDPHHGSKEPHHDPKEPHHDPKDPHHDSKDPHHDPKDPHHDSKDPPPASTTAISSTISTAEVNDTTATATSETLAIATTEGIVMDPIRATENPKGIIKADVITGNTGMSQGSMNMGAVIPKDTNTGTVAQGSTSYGIMVQTNANTETVTQGNKESIAPKSTTSGSGSNTWVLLVPGTISTVAANTSNASSSAGVLEGSNWNALTPANTGYLASETTSKTTTSRGSITPGSTAKTSDKDVSSDVSDADDLLTPLIDAIS